MKKVARVMFLLVFVVLFASGAWATILYWSDYDLGSNPFPDAMTALGISYDTATDKNDFNNKLAGGSYQAAVLLLQNYWYSYSDFSSVPTYLAGGGKMIFTDWTRNSTMGSWFGITYTGNKNLQTVTLTAPFLKIGIGSTMGLSNPGWGIFSMGMALAGAQAGGYFENGDVAVAYGSNFIINGMLKDTFADYSVGLQFAKNELNYITGAPIPLPSAIWLLGPGFAGLIALRRRFNV